MRYKLVTSIFLASCLPALAAPPPAQGNMALAAGRAHIERGAEGTYINLGDARSPRLVVGFIPFGDQSTFPGLDALEGRRVAITGVLVMNGRPTIIMNDRAQLVSVG